LRRLALQVLGLVRFLVYSSAPYINTLPLHFIYSPINIEFLEIDEPGLDVFRIPTPIIEVEVRELQLRAVSNIWEISFFMLVREIPHLITDFIFCYVLFTI
jgi:hypothetical protein